jgi:NADPH:quinone reductase-like Zn-dependent oxidoreductase
MQAIVLTGYGSPERLQLRTVPRPTPATGQVLVRVRAVGMNDWDWAIVTGDSMVTRLGEGIFAPRKRILGLDVAGEVVEVGPGVTGLRPGDRVFGDLSSHGFGGFAQYVSTAESALRIMPATMDFVDAAALPHAANLAMQAIAQAKLQPDHRLLINGAGGGVGTLVVQLATNLGVRDIVGVDDASKLDFMREIGFATALDYRTVDFTRLPEKFDVVIDARSTRSPFEYARALADGGTYVTVGGSIRRLLGIAIWGELIRRLTGKRLSVVVLRTNRDTDAAAALYASGELRPRIDSVWSLAETPEAVARFGRGEHRGKVVISVG